MDTIEDHHNKHINYLGSILPMKNWEILNKKMNKKIKKTNRKKWNKLNIKLKNKLKQFKNKRKQKKLKKYTIFFHKTDPPNQFPWAWIISKKNPQKRPTTLIRIPH